MIRHRALLATAALALLALTGCTQTSPFAPSQEVFGDWRLVEATGETSVAVPVDPASRPTLTIDENSAGGQTPCNRYQASVNGGIGPFSITPTTVTEAACADAALMDLEGAFLEALRAIDTAAVDGDTLTLTGGGIALRFELLGEVAASELLGTEWRLESLITGETMSSDLAGETVASALGEGFLRLEITGALSGNAGCRDVSARYLLDGATVVVSGFELAAADCPGEFLEQEDHVAAVLEDRFTAVIDGDSLRLTAVDGDLALAYTRAP